MSCKSVVYGANTNPQTVVANGVVNFGSISRRYGNNLNLVGGNVAISGAGYYFLDANITFEGTATGTTTIALYKDGVQIPGASVTRSVSDGVIDGVSIPAIVREMCPCESIITAVVSGTSIDITNAAIVAERV